ncbi:class II fructose-bisphosphate aldolase [Desulfobacter curvatus]|uniref:class II fructose-bisphosphate aldolase n=1 Tax=Desulfobacter curvatus TaxID=2290 RepID=UPI00036219DF|nr:class II fructose-bisphosphate aldolase [Desulfobacter curvatus]
MTYSQSEEYRKLLDYGRPPNVKKCFPSSKALIVSGKYIDRAMLAKGGCMTIAANGRNAFVIKGTLAAAQHANAAVIIEIARSEGGTAAYCATSLWNIARQTDAYMNEMGITVPVAIHADHFGIKKPEDVTPAKTEIRSLFDTGITSIAIDASHMPDDQNLLANIELNPYIPEWAGLETEVGEIKGEQGLSTPEEALFLIQGLNAHSIFPDWIALNNGTTHGIEQSDAGINVELTAQIHNSLAPYGISGAQHGTSGNNSDRLRQIAKHTRTTKANVATALQMISWGVKVNDFGNAIMEESGSFIKEPGKGVSQATWEKMCAFAAANDWKKGNFKKLNNPFENTLTAQDAPVRERMVKNVEDFVFTLLTNVFNATDTADLVKKQILETQSYMPGFKAEKIEQKDEWTREKIIEKASLINADKGPEGDFDD